MTRPRPSFFSRLAMALIAIVVFLSLVEGIVRLAGLDTTFQNRFFIVNRALDYPEVFKKDHRLFWKFRPDQTITSRFFEGKTYKINSHGFRGPEIPDATKHPRLVVMGNSCSFGWGVDYDSIYTTMLQERLGGAYDVINAAVPGYTSLQGKRLLSDQLLDLSPDVLVVLFAWNDHWAAAGGIADKDQEFPPQLILDLQNTLVRLHSYRLLKRALLSAVEKNPDSLFDRSDITYRVGPDEFENNLREIMDMTASHGIRTILLTSPIPSLERYYPPNARSPMHAFHYRYNDIIRKVAGATQAELVDIADLFDAEDGLFDDAVRDPIHFNAAGHTVVANALTQHLTGE